MSKDQRVIAHKPRLIRRRQIAVVRRRQTQAGSPCRIETTIRFHLQTYAARAGLLFYVAGSQYRIIITSERLTLLREGVEVASYPLDLLLHVAYWMRCSVNGPLMTIHLWLYGQPEAESWKLFYTTEYKKEQIA